MNDTTLPPAKFIAAPNVNHIYVEVRTRQLPTPSLKVASQTCRSAIKISEKNSGELKISWESLVPFPQPILTIGDNSPNYSPWRINLHPKNRLCKIRWDENWTWPYLNTIQGFHIGSSEASAPFPLAKRVFSVSMASRFGTWHDMESCRRPLGNPIKNGAFTAKSSNSWGIKNWNLSM